MLDLDEIKSRINPNYANVKGTESHERKMLCDEIDRLKLEHETAYKLVDYWQKKCAATQMVDLQLRDALALADGAFEECKDYPITHDAVIEALALPRDTTAIDALKAKVAHEAGEVMRERAISTVTWPYDSNTIRGEIRAIPAVTLEDLRK